MTDSRTQKNCAPLGNASEDISGPSSSATKKGRRNWFKKFFLGSKAPEDGTIQSLIHQKQFYKALKELVAQKNRISDDAPRHTKDIDSLYESLEKEMFQVISESIVQNPGDPLVQVIKAINKQEKEDSKILQNKEIAGHQRTTPRKWKEKWARCVAESVSQRISNGSAISTKNTTSCLSQRFCNLGKTFKNDLIHVIQNLGPLYPPEFNVCNLYARCYHQYFMSEIESVTEYELTEEDTYFLLCWIHNLYPQTILRDPAIQGHIDESQLETLLPTRKIERLEKIFVDSEVNSLETSLEKSLNSESKRWKDGKEPSKVGRYYQSKLQTEVTQIYRDSIRKTAEISEEMSNKMAPHLGKELQNFLTRYQSLFVEYTQKKSQKHFKAITIDNINCSWAFRNFLEDIDLRLERRMKENLISVLQEFEAVGYDALLQNMFEELKSRFRKLCHGNNRKDYFSDIMQYVKSYVTSLKTLCQPCFQVMIGKIHYQVVLEYITRLMEKPVRFEDPIQLGTIANQMVVNANRICSFFSSQGSQETWLHPLLKKLAEIIKLEDPQEIVHNISELAKEYTDIRSEHIIAILHIKGNLDIPKAESVLKKIKYRIRGPNSANRTPLFSLIKPFPPEWLLCSIRRERGDGLCDCLYELYMTMKFIRNMLIDRWCKSINVDTPPKYYPHKPSFRISTVQARRMAQAMEMGMLVCHN
ncbi:tumor necrosis factor alpha-induced protein 2-like [Bufo gargarizans]|uniref:tumor necrosis factor alpha-induced protein 2-like n=1 Tax=Bufo gargarizans TaxID=30331 RepID=UPI001CF3BD06|nr:tumor necrosis factor alpha-induced protein 2-like [Bufo gargarizans]XP_044128501.1 tumor necrosis factor alpha-induced protein 2-like [Bufo gargarizans]